MGCSGIFPHKWNKDNEFYKEALGFRENNISEKILTICLKE